MRLIHQTAEILHIGGSLELIEAAGRTCYKSEKEINAQTAALFVKRLMSHSPPHESVIEHASATVRFITNRGVTHELVRHRLAAYSQESTRYVNYGGNEIEFIKPVWADIQQGTYYRTTTLLEDEANMRFILACLRAENDYKVLLAHGWKPEQAREVLPNALKTEIVMTANMREWRHVFKLRCSERAHPQIRELMRGLATGFRKIIPVLFDEFVFDQ